MEATRSTPALKHQAEDPQGVMPVESLKQALPVDAWPSVCRMGPRGFILLLREIVWPLAFTEGVVSQDRTGTNSLMLRTCVLAKVGHSSSFGRGWTVTMGDSRREERCLALMA